MISSDTSDSPVLVWVYTYTQVDAWVLQALYHYVSKQNYLIHPKIEQGKETCLTFLHFHLSSAITLVASASMQPITSYFLNFLRSRELCFYSSVTIHEDGHLTWDICHHLESLDLQIFSDHKLLFFLLTRP